MIDNIRGSTDRTQAAAAWGKVAAGVGSGLLGGAAAALILYGAWMLPLMGLILTRVSLWRGLAATLIVGAAGGVVYSRLAGLIGAGRLRIAAAGLALGLTVWLIGPLVLIPLWLGLPAFPASPLDQLPTLGAFLAYGLVVAISYPALTGETGAFGPPAQGMGRGVQAARSGRRLGRRRGALLVSLGLVLLCGLAGIVLLRGATTTDPEALVLPSGYRAEVVAEGFTYPTSLAVAADGTVYVGEAGYVYGPKSATARVLAVSPGSVVAEVARGFDGPLGGLALQDGLLYVSHRGKVTVLELENQGPPAGPRRDPPRHDFVSGLPSLGDHQNNDIKVGPDGLLYLGQGTATNAGVVGSDNFVYAWADRYPEFCDVPSRDWILTGISYPDRDLRTANPADSVLTDAFAPFGTVWAEGTTLQGDAKAGGTVLQIDPGTGGTRVYADGLRNPYGLAFAADGSLYTTNLGYDDRGVRAVKGSPDWLVRIREGAWYGWPDYAGLRPLSDPAFASRRGSNLEPLIANPPPVEGQLAEFAVHSSPMKPDVSPGGRFGDPGGIYVPLFGDAEPLTEDLPGPVPTGVVRVDPDTGQVRPFLRNRTGGRAARYDRGIKRAVACAFDPSGDALHVLDFGCIETTDLAPNAIPRTGVLWRIIPAAGTG